MTAWTALVITPHESRSVAVTKERSVTIGGTRPASVELHGVDRRAVEMTLSSADDAVVVEVPDYVHRVSLNDVPVSGRFVLRAGDLLSVGPIETIVWRDVTARAAVHRMATPEELHARLHEEVERARGRRSVGMVVLSAPTLNAVARQALLRRVADAAIERSVNALWSQVAPDTFGGVLVESAAEALEAFLRELPEKAGQRAQVGVAVAPPVMLDAEALWEQAWERLLGPPFDDDVVLHDPLTVRVVALIEAHVKRQRVLVLTGPSGAGRATLARYALGAEVLIRRPGDEPLDREQRRAAPATVLYVDCDALPFFADEAAALLEGGARVVATARSKEAWPDAKVSIPVPALRHRPGDIVPLAEHFLTRARRRLNRPRLVLGVEAKHDIEQWSWPGNVRELKNTIYWAAKVTVRDEVGRDALPKRMSADAQGEELRVSLQSAERTLLLEALARTKWNVTAAAERLGMPRRTLVFRMSKLGLKRPAR